MQPDSLFRAAQGGDSDTAVKLDADCREALLAVIDGGSHIFQWR